MAESSCVLIIRAADARPFWDDIPENEKSDSHEIVEATLVDDEAFALVAKSPKALYSATKVLLETVTEVFEKFLLKLY